MRRFLKNKHAQSVFQAHMRFLTEQGRGKLSKHEMLLYVNGKQHYAGNGKSFFAEVLAREEHDPDESWGTHAETKVSPSTVYRWMLLCNAEYKTHKQGFADSRNKIEIIIERNAYNEHKRELEPRMKQWERHDGGARLIDFARADDEAVAAGDRVGNMWHEAANMPPPTVEFEANQCPEGHAKEECKCDRPLLHIGHDECVLQHDTPHHGGDMGSSWWNSSKFALQAEFMLACVTNLYPEYQVLLEIDQRSGHMKFAEDSLKTSNLRFTDGGTLNG
jgi:hypothetical protein